LQWEDCKHRLNDFIDNVNDKTEIGRHEILVPSVMEVVPLQIEEIPLQIEERHLQTAEETIIRAI
jgi:hypothetical protein